MSNILIYFLAFFILVEIGFKPNHISTSQRSTAISCLIIYSVLVSQETKQTRAVEKSVRDQFLRFNNADHDANSSCIFYTGGRDFLFSLIFTFHLVIENRLCMDNTSKANRKRHCSMFAPRSVPISKNEGN